MNLNSSLLVLIGVMVGLITGGIAWLIWSRVRSQNSPPSDLGISKAINDPLQQRIKELTILHAVAKAGAEATEEDRLVEQATQIIGENLFPNNFGILLLAEDGENLRTHPSYRELAETRGPEYISMGSGITGQVAKTGEPMRVGDVSLVENYIKVDKSTRSELCVPLKVGERVIGVINAERDTIDGFSESDERLLSTIAGQLATAIDRLRADSAVHKRANQLSILSNISQEVGASLIPEEVYLAIHQAASRLMVAEVFEIVLYDEGLQKPVSVYSVDKGESVELPSERNRSGLSGFIISTGEKLLINNRQELDKFDLEHAGDEGQANSILAVPLRLAGNVFGMLSCQSYQPHAYTPEDLDTLSTLANQAAIAIENARLFEETQHRLAELTFLSQIIAITATENDLTVALNLICSELARFLQVPEVSFALLNSQLTMAQVIAEYHDPDRPKTLGKQIPVIGNPAMTSVLENAVHLVIEDARSDPLSAAVLDHTSQRGIKSLLLVPIIFGGEVVGTLEVSSLSHRQFTLSEISLVEKVSNQVGQVLERLGLFAATRDQAERMAHLATISEGLNRPLSSEEVIDSIGKGAMTLGQAERAALFLRQADGEVTAPWSENLSQGYLEQATEVFDEVSGGTMFTRSEPISLPDVDLLPEEPRLKLLAKQEGFRAVDLWPLLYKDDVVAVIGCYYDEAHIGSDAELEVMLAFARQAAVALVNARLFDETRRRTAQLEALNAIITEVAAASDLEHLLRITLEHTLRALGLEIGGIWVEEQSVLEKLPDRIGELLQKIIQEAEGGIAPPIAINDWQMVEKNNPLYEYSSSMHTHDLRASLSVALISEGRQIGGLSVISGRPHYWLPEEIALVGGVGRQLGGAVERIALLERIQENALQVQYIIDTVPEGVILLDEEKRIVLANPVAQSYLIYLASINPQDVLTHLGKKPLDEILSPASQNSWYEFESPGPPHQVFELSAQPLEGSGTQGGWVIVLREVTQERETQSRIQMQERLATVGQLAAGIAHDFNNILAAIVVYADLLRRDPNLLPGSQERLNIIQQQVQRAASLIRQILDFSRRSVMEQSTLDLLPFFKELDKLLQRVLPETIQIEFSYEPGIYLINADPTRLQQVFMNLAVNARDASAEGGVLRFELDQIQVNEAEAPPCPDIPTGTWNRISVKDNGEGIPAEILPHIFEPFFTTKPVGEGTGLGLAQAYGIIKQHDGYIDAHSITGEGATFHIYLPAQQPVAEVAQMPDASLAVPGSGETILLVEDDYSTREAMKTFLIDLNYEVITASNGREALSLYEDQPEVIDLVVCDIVMPVMGGVDLYQTLRKKWPEVKMLFITGHPVDEYDQELLESGNVHWLQKPFSVGVFNKAVQNFLDE